MTRRPGEGGKAALRVGFALTLFNSWVLFEETVIDRLGWWRYMACYRVGRFCEWDVGAIVAILAITIVAFRDTRQWAGEHLRSLCGRLGCPACGTT